PAFRVALIACATFGPLVRLEESRHEFSNQTLGARMDPEPRPLEVSAIDTGAVKRAVQDAAVRIHWCPVTGVRRALRTLRGTTLHELELQDR
ncbi:MAG TPA: hypothetical protein VG963_01275, partial [Polyangiaceae bacterium]|nr:hypothetical protein [Polyangiaceae bacterium]